jgi:hypothetical protein
MRSAISKKTGIGLLLVHVGDTISIRYLPVDPEVHALGASPRRDSFMVWIAGLWLALAGVYWRFGS